MKKVFLMLIVGIIFAGFLAAIFGYFVLNEAHKVAAQTTINSKTLDQIPESQFVELAKPRVLGVEDKRNGAMLASENYQIKQITFGGEIAVASGNNTDDIRVSDVRGELLMTKDQKDYRFLITWKTNKLTKSEISYTSAGASEKNVKENGFGLTHSAVLAQLQPGTAYSYQIKTTDQWGNTVVSDKYAMYTSEKSLSVIELITKEFSGMFGWATK